MCPDRPKCKLNSLPTGFSSLGVQAPEGFATLTENSDGSFKIVLNSSDASKIGEFYRFPLKTIAHSDILDSIPLGY